MIQIKTINHLKRNSHALRYDEPEMPSISRRALNLAKAAPDIIKNPKRVPAEIQVERLRLCREACPQNNWNPKANLGLGGCRICGCCSIKHYLAGQKCPINIWGVYRSNG